MRIEIEIPKEFDVDYTGDKFKDFFSRVLCDIKEGKCLCGSYEIETAEMFINAFDESKPAYDVEKVMAELEELKLKRSDDSVYGVGVLNGYSEAIDYIRRNGGKE